MRLTSIRIKNFRNFHDFSVEFDSYSMVIVGENNAGKSNLLYALRLLFDETLPNSARRLSSNDFWDGLDRPFAGKEIHIVVEISDISDNVKELASFHDCLRDRNGSTTVVLAYVYRPRIEIDNSDPESLAEEQYTYYFCCDDDISKQIRNLTFQKYIPFQVLSVLRNATMLVGGQGNPLRRLVSRLISDIDIQELQELGNGVDAVLTEILALEPVADLQSKITTRLGKMIGERTSFIDPLLGFLPTEPERLLQFIRLFAEGLARRDLEEIGTGYVNIIYLVLLLLDAQQKEQSNEQVNMILAVEEPEAHLHPHLQRSVFRDLFQAQNKLPVLITTHSPHISSVAPLTSIVMLQKKELARDQERPDQKQRRIWHTIGKNIKTANLTEEDIKSIERHLDVTRAELLFSSGVILVEGIVESILLNEFAQKKGIRLDEHGITIVVVGGTHFAPFYRLLGSKGFDLPTVVITDGDPSKNEDGNIKHLGLQRGVELLRVENSELSKNIETESFAVQRVRLGECGIFVGEHTLEIDLISAGYTEEYIEIFREFGAGERSIQNTRDVFEKWGTLDFEERETKIISKIEALATKGAFSQKLASRITPNRIPWAFDQAFRFLGLQ